MGDCQDIKSCILFVGNFVPIHPDLGNFSDSDLLFTERRLSLACKLGG